MLRMLGAKNNRQRALRVRRWLSGVFFLRFALRWTLWRSFFLLCELGDGFLVVFFWRFALRWTLWRSFFLRFAVALARSTFPHSTRAPVATAKHSWLFAQKKTTARGSLSKAKDSWLFAPEKQPPESLEPAKQKKTTARGSLSKAKDSWLFAQKKTHQKALSQQSPLPVVLCA